MHIERLGRRAEPTKVMPAEPADWEDDCFTLHCRPNEEQWGSRGGEGGKAFTPVLTLKERLTRRQRNKWDVDYLPLLLLVGVRWICASSHPLVTCLYGTVGSNKRKAPNKAAP